MTNSPCFRRFHFTAILAVCVLFAQGSQAVAERQSDAASRFDMIWSATKNRLYDRNMNGKDWNAIGEKYRPIAAGANSALEFQETINRMLGELQVSHIGYYTDQDVEYYLLSSVFNQSAPGRKVNHIGVTGKQTKDGYLVGAVLNGSPAEEAGIRVGDRLLTVEGQPFTAVGSFAGSSDQTYSLVLNRAGAGKLTISVNPIHEAPQESFLRATKSSARILQEGPHRIGYIHLWCMTGDAFRQAMDEAITGTLQKTDGLILDLRDGFGGTPFRFADVLFRPAVEWEDSRRTDSRTSYTGYNRPVVALINQGTRSAKEFFAYELKKTRRATLVGTRTAGAFLGASGVRIGDDALLELPVTDLKVDGKRLEGVGVSPDITVEPQDTYRPGDAQLARAITALKEKLDIVRRPGSTAAAF